jgi:hypothetical protein
MSGYTTSPPSSSRYSQPPSVPSPLSTSNHTPSASTSTLPLPSLSKRPLSSSHPNSLQQQLFGNQAPTQGQGGGIHDRPLNRTRGAEVGLGAFAFLLSEIVSYSQSRVDSVNDLEKRYVEPVLPTYTRVLTISMLTGCRVWAMKQVYGY